MQPTCQRVHEPQLHPARSLQEYDLHLAALQWSLAEPIIIQDAADIRSRVNWKDLVDPLDHQIRNLLTFCRKAPVMLLADDVGLGKTISAGLILSELITRRKIARALVLAPKILLKQWTEELRSKFGIDASDASGKADVESELKRTAQVVVTTYHSAKHILTRDHLERASMGMLILDEAHKLRNLHGSNKPPMLAMRVREALRDHLFRYVVMLTATPIQNSLWDEWHFRPSRLRLRLCGNGCWLVVVA